MEEIAARLYSISDNPLEQVDNVKMDDSLVKMTENDILTVVEQEQVCRNSNDEYSIELPVHSQETLDEAMMKSLFNSNNPRPLALYICEQENIMTQLFQETILWSDSISIYLNEQFVVWEWNLTSENYTEFLEVIVKHLGEEAAAIIASSPQECYPLLVCLIFDHGQIKVESIIQGSMSESETFSLLVQAHDAFRDRFELPDTTGLNMTMIATENWSIPPSTLTEVSKTSDEFQRVADDFDGGAASIVRIDRIENTIWLIQYVNQKSIVDARLGHDQSEKLLFHGCPYDAAEKILQQGFDHNRIGRHGTSYGCGFYFSNRRSLSDQYAIPHPSTKEKRILMCRVLVGRSCPGSSFTQTCPRNYDSTSNQSNIHVVYSNRHVLPEYLITYK